MIQYTATNEMLRAITYGLSLRPFDRVLAICGSGDQAFAISEYVSEVVAIDREFDQLEYAAKKLENVKKGDYDKFLEVDDNSINKKLIDRRTKYFSKKGRLDKIRAKSNILFLHADLKNFHNYTDFSRVYLSNACSMTDLNQTMEDLSRQLPDSSLVYSTDAVEWRGRLGTDVMLTSIAKAIELFNFLYEWSPVVYRK